MYAEEDYIQLSALQHYLFCPRQCALAYMEMSWEENELTALGRILHEKVHSEFSEKRNDLLIARGLRLSSARLGLSGQADVVEFRKTEGDGVRLAGRSGYWNVFPVEYKRGKPKSDSSDQVQLCAQAMCLEEMLEIDIPEGALFYGKNRRRQQIVFYQSLRRLTEDTCEKVHRLIASQDLPPAEESKKCLNCSLRDICLPKASGQHGKVQNYVKKIYKTLL